MNIFCTLEEPVLKMTVLNGQLIVLTEKGSYLVNENGEKTLITWDAGLT
jgi:hypothetical protein